MPVYEYQCLKCSSVFDIYVKGFAHSDKDVVCEECGNSNCEKQLTSPTIVIGADKPDRYERAEKAHASRVKDPERARRMRKKKFGTEGISITKSPYYHKQKKIKAQGASDVDKKTFIQQAAKNPNALAAAKKVLGK